MRNIPSRSCPSKVQQLQASQVCEWCEVHQNSPQLQAYQLHHACDRQHILYARTTHVQARQLRQDCQCCNVRNFCTSQAQMHHLGQGRQWCHICHSWGRHIQMLQLAQ